MRAGVQIFLFLCWPCLLGPGAGARGARGGPGPGWPWWPGAARAGGAGVAREDARGRAFGALQAARHAGSSWRPSSCAAPCAGASGRTILLRLLPAAGLWEGQGQGQGAGSEGAGMAERCGA